MMIKYKLSEVAKDFGLSNKEISEILGKYLKAPRSNAQALNERELDVVFESLTQNKQHNVHGAKLLNGSHCPSHTLPSPSPRHTRRPAPWAIWKYLLGYPELLLHSLDLVAEVTHLQVCSRQPVLQDLHLWALRLVGKDRRERGHLKSK